MSDFEKRFVFKKQVLVHFIPWKRRILLFLCFPKKHDFELRLLQGVRFWKINFTTCQISDWKIFASPDFDWFFKNFCNVKLQSSPTTCTFPNFLLYTALYNESLEFLCQLHNSIHVRSNISSGIHFQRTLILIALGCPTLISVWAWQTQKFAATRKIIDNDKRTDLSHTCHVWLVFEKNYYEMKHVVDSFLEKHTQQWYYFKKVQTSVTLIGNIRDSCSKGATSHQYGGVTWSLGDWSFWKKRRVLFVFPWSIRIGFSDIERIWNSLNFQWGKGSNYNWWDNCILVQVKIPSVKLAIFEIGRPMHVFVNGLCAYVWKNFIPHLQSPLLVGVVFEFALVVQRVFQNSKCWSWKNPQQCQWSQWWESSRRVAFILTFLRWFWHWKGET